MREKISSYDDKNLQQIFSDFYNKAKEAKPTTSNLMNSAKASIGSLGSRLEQRRAKFKQNLDIDKEFTT